MTEVVLTSHAAEQLRKLNSRDPAEIQRLFSALKKLSFNHESDLSMHVVKGLSAAPDKSRLYSLRSGKYRVLYTADAQGTGSKIYVVGIVSSDEPEGSIADFKEVVVSTATG